MLIKFLPVDSFRLVTIETQRSYKVAWTTTHFCILVLSRRKRFIYSRRAQESNQSRAKLLP